MSDNKICERHKKWRCSDCFEIEELNKEVEELKEREKKLIECVRFYGNVSSWRYVTIGYGPRALILLDDYEDMSTDDAIRCFGGKFARQTLRELGIKDKE